MHRHRTSSFKSHPRRLGNVQLIPYPRGLQQNKRGSGNRTSAPVQALDHKSHRSLPLGYYACKRKFFDLIWFLIDPSIMFVPFQIMWNSGSEKFETPNLFYNFTIDGQRCNMSFIRVERWTSKWKLAGSNPD